MNVNILYKCIVKIIAKGELTGDTAGRYTNISHLAQSLAHISHQELTTSLSITIETMNDEQIIVKDYDSMTVVLKYSNAGPIA